MSTVFLVLFILIISGKIKVDNRHSGLFRGLVIAGVICSLFSYILFPLSGIVLTGILIYLGYWWKNKKKSDSRKEQYGWDPQRWDREQGNETVYGEYRREKSSAKKGAVLPQSASKRKKIVENFNEKYHLCLTKEQIQGIVNSTYMSEIWRKEAEAMNRKYETIYEWFQGYTKWLRVYVYVFHVQEITSDIRQQENICMYAFEEVFRYADQFQDIPLQEKIRHVNDKFYASFDDVTFMIAYRFLESKGLHHELGSMDLVKEDQNLDELLHKYKASESGSDGE